MRVLSQSVTTSAAGGGAIDTARGQTVVASTVANVTHAASHGRRRQIQVWTYGGGTDRQWKPVQAPDGSYHFAPRNNTNNCLDVTNVSTSDGTRLQQWSGTDGVARQ